MRGRLRQIIWSCARLRTLGETGGWRQYSVIAIGFIGVIAIIQPGSGGFTVNSLWPIAAVCFKIAFTTERPNGECWLNLPRHGSTHFLGPE
jgi:drug/metabolite transporter (DMT)-like permease